MLFCFVSNLFRDIACTIISNGDGECSKCATLSKKAKRKQQKAKYYAKRKQTKPCDGVVNGRVLKSKAWVHIAPKQKGVSFSGALSYLLWSDS